jgi:tetratricopeptide (TPR) repeat protein
LILCFIACPCRTLILPEAARIRRERARRDGKSPLSQHGSSTSNAGTKRSGSGDNLVAKARRGRAWLSVGAFALILIVGVVGFKYRAGRTADIAPDRIWERAEQDFQAGRIEPASAALARLTQLRQPTPLDRFLRAQIEMKGDRPDAALAEIALIPDEHKIAGRAQLLAGRIELNRGRLRIAEDLLHSALALDPALPEAHSKLIYIYSVHLRRAELDSEFVALSKLGPLSFRNILDWCIVVLNSWEPESILEDLMRFVAADPADRWSRLGLAEIYRRMGWHGLAESTLAALTQDDCRANAIRTQIAFDRADYAQAEELLKNGPGDDPEFARLRGRQALARRDGRTAKKQFEIAYASDPVNHETIFGLRSAAELLGDGKLATTMREVARERNRLSVLIGRANDSLEPGQVELARELGLACAALHLDLEARAWLLLAITRNPLDNVAHQALYRLKVELPAGKESSRSTPSVKSE